MAGPTMDHQIIRSLFRACIEATEVLGEDKDFADRLRSQVGRIAPNRVGAATRSSLVNGSGRPR